MVDKPRIRFSSEVIKYTVLCDSCGELARHQTILEAKEIEASHNCDSHQQLKHRNIFETNT